MKKYLLFVVLLSIFISSTSFADCRGCCTGRGGIDCVNGITICKDGTAMSVKCREKCDKCGTDAKSSTSSSNNMSIEGNTWNDSFGKSKKTLEQKVNASYRSTFYCNCPFDEKKEIGQCKDYTPKNVNQRSKRVEWEHIVPAAHFGQSFKEWRDGHPNCVNSKGKSFKGRGCASKISKTYRYMESDLYNLVPAIGEVNGLRSNFRFDMIAGEKRDFGTCDMEIDSSAKIAEPPAGIRGDIARTYKYMHQAYPGHGIIAEASRKLFDAWDKLDPVDAWECRRSAMIEEIQGNENRVVKDACLRARLW